MYPTTMLKSVRTVFFFRFGAHAGVRHLDRSDGPEGGLRRGVDERPQGVTGRHRVSFFHPRFYFFRGVLSTAAVSHALRKAALS